MNKKILAAIALGVVGSSQAVAAPAAGLVGGVVGTVEGVLAKPVRTVGAAGLSLVVGGVHGLSGTLAVVRAVPGVLTGGPIAATSTDVTIPLPGPSYLALPLVRLPGKIDIIVTGASPVNVRIATGSFAK